MLAQTKKIGIALLSSSIILVGCNQATPTNEDVATETSELSQDDQELLSMFKQNNFAGRDYTIDATFSGAGLPGNQGTMQAKFDAEGKSHMTVDSEQGTVEMITTPEANYVRIGEDKPWVKQSIAAIEVPEINFTEEDFNSTFTAEGVTPNYQGTEPCGQLTCHVFTASDESNQTTTIMFDTEDYLMRQVSIADESGEENTVINFSYGPVSIEVPTEVTEIPDFTNLSPEEMQEQVGKLQELYAQ